VTSCGLQAESELEFSGVIAYEPRWYISDAQFDDQFNGIQNSFFAEPEIFLEIGDKHQFSFIPFARYDARDNDRTHADIREAFWRYIDDDKEVLIGLNREFWGVTESRHLVNVINQIDQVENIDEEDFLGQLMLSASIQKDYGRFSFFIMPLFRERTFPSNTGRLRGPIDIDVDDAQYESGAEQWHTDLALRYSHFLGEWDIGASYFYGTGREPTLILNDEATQLIPEYEIIHQIGLDIQYTNEEWLWKFEGIVREGQGHTFAATVAGFEYTIFQAFNSDADFGFLMEHLYDGRDQLNAPISPFDNDLFIGMRYTFNDINDTNFLAGALTDLENESNGIRLEADRRIGNYWRVQVESQWFSNTREGTFNESVKDDDFTQLNVSRYF
jgi:hypothetical protein